MYFTSIFQSLDTNKDGVISNEEIEHAYNILKKSGKLPSMMTNQVDTSNTKKNDIKLSPNQENYPNSIHDFIHNS